MIDQDCRKGLVELHDVIVKWSAEADQAIAELKARVDKLETENADLLRRIGLKTPQ